MSAQTRVPVLFKLLLKFIFKVYILKNKPKQEDVFMHLILFKITKQTKKKKLTHIETPQHNS